MNQIFRHFYRLLLLTVISMSTTVTAQEEVAPGVWLASGGSYRLSFSSQYFPVPADVPHQWILYILDGNRRPIENAQIEIHGYHPESREVLPRMTYISAHMGRGAYQVDNMYFPTGGEWQLNIVISSGSTVDSVLVPLEI